MIRNLCHRMVPVAVAAVLSLISVACQADDADAVRDAEIAALIQQIQESDGTVHHEATTKLQKFGAPAVAPLAKAAEAENGLIVTRCFDALGRLLVSDDPATSEAARDALTTLSESKINLVGRRARTTLRLEDFLWQREPLLAAAGPARVTRVATTKNGKSIRLERAADGSFKGRIKDSADGEGKESEIKAASEKELADKFPEAHAAFQRQNPQPGAGPVPNPAGNLGGNPGGIPGLPQPGALPPGIQINGRAFGGGEVVTTRVTVVDGKRQVETTRTSMANGKRHIQAQIGEEKIEIDDTNGKDIQLKHTRSVDGKAKTDEYKGDDLDDLKKKHPEAAKLYEKHTAGNRVVLGGGGGVQLQIGGPPLPGGVRPVPAPGFQFDQPVPAPASPRTIRAEQDGRKIEITDEDGKNIRVKLTKMVDGKGVSQEFSADDLKTLKSEHPEAAKLYEQFTGRRED
jgi:hypothetical protein